VRRVLPRERVEASLAFRTPDRIPLQLFPSPAGLHEHGRKLLDLARECRSDFGDMALLELPDPPPASDHERDGRYHAIRTDEWGTTWEHRIFGIWGHPLAWPLDDWSALDGWKAPEAPALAGPAFEAAKVAVDRHRQTWYLSEGIGDLFERLRAVRRFESMLIDVVEDGPEINRAADIILAHDETLVRRALALGADMAAFGDDLGTTNAMMISPETFRRFLKERYRRLFAPVVRAGRRVLFHCCGRFEPVMADLREVGVDAIWPQLPLYDHRELSRRCRDLGLSVMLHPDRGELMQRGTPVRIRDYVRRLVDEFDTAHGGSWLYVEIDPGFPWENVEALFRVAMELRG
jgi:hypothetical protein